MKNEVIKPMVISFTGHRPNNIHMGGYDWDSAKNEKIRQRISILVSKIAKKHKDEDCWFVCGGALGVDQMAFDVCLRLKQTYKNIFIEIAIPFKTQFRKWKAGDIARWKMQIKQADKVTIVDEVQSYVIAGYEEGIYYPAKMQKRNEYMVDKSDFVIAIWDGTSGGTGNCVKYAVKCKKPVVRIDPSKF